MARKSSTETVSPHKHDVLGLLLCALGILLLLALISYDGKDLGFNTSPPNVEAHNWIGTVGARLAYGFFLIFGLPAFLIPEALVLVGLGCLFARLSYIQRRWLWTSVLILAWMGLLDLYNGYLANFRQDYGIPSAGGMIGQGMNKMVFGHFGTPGATILFLTIFALSALYLTNFQLGSWLRDRWEDYQLAKAAGPDKGPRGLAAAEEARALEKRAKELEKQKKKLEGDLGSSEEVAGKSGLGADLQPVPEPTVRDLSQSHARTPKKVGKGAAADDGLFPPLDAEPAEVIPGAEVRAATSADILGRSAKTEQNEGKSADDDGLPLPLPSAPTGRGRMAARKSKPITVAATPLIGNYQLPKMNLLNQPEPVTKPTESKEELMANARLMQSTLAQFDIDVSLGDITKGPTITRYELHPAPGVKLEKISALNNNIAAALKAERLNILAPIPGKSSVGIEVPNLVKTKVIMRDLLESDEWINSKARIPLALGKDVYGQPIIADLAEMPHLLIAGSTGSGKSVCINSIVASLLYKFSPDELRFVMIDPKVVELQQYNSLPHLVVPVVTDPKKVVLALRWVVNEMEKRYQIFAKVGVRNIKSFNERPKAKPEPVAPPVEPELPLNFSKDKAESTGEGFAVELDKDIVVPREDDIVIPDKLSYVVVIIDELADLMLVAPADVEMAIARITQMARAAGIHCIVATQRPSVDVITGVIKANIPARIAFQVAAKVDSRTILDAMGADKLLGKGDMLYLPPGAAKITRAQGVLITDSEIQSCVDFISKQGKPSYEMEITQQLAKATGSSLSDESGCDEDEELIQQCIEVIRSEQKASVSLMQRRLRLGYTRAARIMDELEGRGIVGPSKGAEPRDILIDLDVNDGSGA